MKQLADSTAPCRVADVMLTVRSPIYTVYIHVHRYSTRRIHAPSTLNAQKRPSINSGSRGRRLGQLPRAPRKGAQKREEECKNKANLHNEKHVEGTVCKSRPGHQKPYVRL